jgi:hypothetical protein
MLSQNTLTGYACACTPYTGHPGNGSYRPAKQARSQALGDGVRDNPGGGYHLDGWAAPPTRPAVVLDPFGGTGTTATVAAALGRVGVTVDLSADYCRLAAWRTTDPRERAKARGVAWTPPKRPVSPGQGALF